MFHYPENMEPNQREQLPGTVPNSAGGYGFEASIWTRLDRFLILGTEADTYYSTARELTRENANSTLRCIAEDGPRVVARVVEISESGRAPKNDPALFVLAMCSKHPDSKTRAAAFLALPRVARMSTHLFHFVEYMKALGGGWGTGTTRAFKNWYLDKTDEQLVYQAIKYQTRDGWAHRDLLRKSHPVPRTSHLANYERVPKVGDQIEVRSFNTVNDTWGPWMPDRVAWVNNGWLGCGLRSKCLLTDYGTTWRFPG